MVAKNFSDHPNSEMNGHERSFATIQWVWMIRKKPDHPNTETDAETGAVKFYFGKRNQPNIGSCRTWNPVCARISIYVTETQWRTYIVQFWTHHPS